MSFKIIESIDETLIYCTGSFTKFLTTFVTLSFLSEHYHLEEILDDDQFLDSICVEKESKEFLILFQNIISNKFTIRDLYSHYSGLPYTFDLSLKELQSVESGHPFKHHAIPNEAEFLARCHHNITPVYRNRCKFHYSEIAIIFLGYLVEKVFHVKMEHLYQHYVVDKYQLKSSFFSRTRPDTVYCQDLSNEYDYPSIAILDHGYFCYSNGYYTNLLEMASLLEQVITSPIFNTMTELKTARAASNKLLNGLSVEIRMIADDILYGYEGLSFSGCSLWAYSTKHKQGYVTFSNNEETIYDTVYGQWRYDHFDPVPEYTQHLYRKFLQEYTVLHTSEKRDVPFLFQGNYQRVRINQKSLDMIFVAGNHFIIIRNPDTITYDLVYANNHYCVQGKDGIHGGKVGFYEAESGNHYMCYDGTLYKKISNR